MPCDADKLIMSWRKYCNRLWTWMATTMVSGSTGPKISSLRILCSSLMPLIRVRMYEMFELDIGIAFGAEKITMKC